MQPRFQPRRKANGEKLLPRRDQYGPFKISIRSALLLSLAQYVALVDASLLYAAHQAVPLIVASVTAAFVAAYHFFDGLIELEPE
jgi:hypothetical protein